MQDGNESMFWQLGFRDAVANVLTFYKDKVKLPDLAQQYKESFEEHFSHKWHIN